MKVKLMGLKKFHSKSDAIQALGSLVGLSVESSKAVIHKLQVSATNSNVPPIIIELDMPGDNTSAAYAIYSLSCFFEIKYDKRNPQQLHLYKVDCRFDNDIYQRKTAILLATDRAEAYEAAKNHKGVREIISVHKIGGPFRNQQILYFG